MKRFFLTTCLFLLVPIITLGQQKENSPKNNTVYYGYEQLFLPKTISKDTNHYLSSSDFLIVKISDGYSLRPIKPNSTSKVYLIDKRTKDTIQDFTYIIKMLPLPILVSCSAKNDTILSKRDACLETHYKPNSNLKANFTIEKIELSIAGNPSVYTTTGKVLSQEMLDLLSNTQNGIAIQITATVVGPDKLVRKIRKRFVLSD